LPRLAAICHFLLIGRSKQSTGNNIHIQGLVVERSVRKKSQLLACQRSHRLVSSVCDQDQGSVFLEGLLNSTNIGRANIKLSKATAQINSILSCTTAGRGEQAHYHLSGECEIAFSENCATFYLSKLFVAHYVFSP